MRTPGRHRAADVSAASLLISAAKHHASPATKVAGVAAATGGLMVAASMPATAAPVEARTTVASAPSVASAGHLGRVSMAGLKKSRLKRVSGVVRKRTAVKRAYRRTAVRHVSRSYRRAAVRHVSRSYHRVAVKHVNRSIPRVSRHVVRRAAVKRVAVKRTANVAPRAVRGGGVLSTAASLSGIYYRYGGTSTSGFDCSGYTQYVFRANGKSLPRTAAAQQAATRRVSSPQPGDLVFFSTPAYHVGIYAGGGMMYDSPRTGRTTGLHKIWSSNVTYGRA